MKKRPFRLYQSGSPPLLKIKGQVVVEYILLLVVSVLMATILIAFVDESKGGELFKKWRNLLTTIAQDIST